MSAHPIAHRHTSPACTCESCIAQRARDREARGFWEEPSPEQVREWQDELSRDMNAQDRTPVAVIPGAYEWPLVVCRDGSTWQLWEEPQGEGDRRRFWQQYPPIPGSPADVAGDYWLQKEAR